MIGFCVIILYGPMFIYCHLCFFPVILHSALSMFFIFWLVKAVSLHYCVLALLLCRLAIMKTGSLFLIFYFSSLVFTSLFQIFLWGKFLNDTTWLLMSLGGIGAVFHILSKKLTEHHVLFAGIWYHVEKLQFSYILAFTI